MFTPVAHRRSEEFRHLIADLQHIGKPYEFSRILPVNARGRGPNMSWYNSRDKLY